MLVLIQLVFRLTICLTTLDYKHWLTRDEGHFFLCTGGGGKLFDRTKIGPTPASKKNQQEDSLRKSPCDSFSFFSSFFGHWVELKRGKERGISQRLWKIRPRRTKQTAGEIDLGWRDRTGLYTKGVTQPKFIILPWHWGWGWEGWLFSNLITCSKCLIPMLIQVSPMWCAGMGGGGKEEGKLIVVQKTCDVFRAQDTCCHLITQSVC